MLNYMRVKPEQIQELIDRANSGDITQVTFCHEIALLLAQVTEESKRDNDLMQELNDKNRRILDLQDHVINLQNRLEEYEFLELDWEMMNDFVSHKKLNTAYSEFAKRKLTEPEKPTLTRIK